MKSFGFDSMDLGSYKKFLSMWMTQLDLCIRKIKSDSKEGDKSQGEHAEGSCNSLGKMVYIHLHIHFLNS